MKKTLLVAMAALPLLGATAAEAPAGHLKSVKERVVAAAPVKQSAKKAHKIAKGVTELTPVVTEPGQRVLKELRTPLASNKINPLRSVRAPKAETPQGSSFYENFEGWDGVDPTWLPDGWSRDTKTGQVVSADNACVWGLTAVNPLSTPAGYEGNYFMGISYSSDYLDEWLITPALTISEGEDLYFSLYYDIQYIYSIDNVDWETMTYVGEKVLCHSLEVLAREEGSEEWTSLWDLSDQYKDYTLDQVYADAYDILSHFQNIKVSLGEVTGKKVEIAFRYYGTDGNSMYLDAVKVALPELEGVNYTSPFETLYFGVSNEGVAYGSDFGVFPAYSPITWTNNVWDDDVTTTWTYDDPQTADQATQTGGDLTLTYLPDYSSEANTRNNMHYTPTLTGEAAGASTVTYQAPYALFQTGGRPDVLGDDGSVISLGMTALNFNTSGLSYHLVDYGTSMFPTPIFGHDENTSAFWTDYTLNEKDDEEEEDLTVEVTALYNFIYPGNSPLVVSGASLMAFGRFPSDVEMKFELIPLTDEYEMSDVVLASGTCKGSDYVMADPQDFDLILVNAKFDTPAVIDDTYVAYIIRLSGFNDERVEYFAPQHGYYPNPDYLCHAYITKRITWNGDVRDSQYPIAYQANENGDLYTAFAITLDAEYPWLATESNDIELTENTTSIKLDSYYDGSELEVITPEGLKGEVKGRYNNCYLTLTHVTTDQPTDGEVYITGPGVLATLNITDNYTDGIGSIISDAKAGEVKEAYTLTGSRVNLDEAPAGVYVVKYADGTSAKLVRK